MKPTGSQGSGTRCGPPRRARPVTYSVRVEGPTGSPGRGGEAWASYMAAAGAVFAIYAVGSSTPYLRTQLGLSDAEVGLHSSALAVGFVVTGLFAGRLDRLVGEVAVRLASIVGLVVGVAALAIAPALGITLAASLLIGLGGGTLVGYANAVLARSGGRLARLQVARASMWSIAAAFLCPVALATATALGLPWGVGLAPAPVLLVFVAIDLRGGPRLERPDAATKSSGRLPTGYWFAWTFLVMAIAIEFSVVFWGATLIERRTGVDAAAATLLGGLFIGGMLAGRVAQSFGLGTHGGVRRPAAIGVVLAAVGASIAWVSTVGALSGAGLFVAGLGVGGLYPLGTSAALAAAHRQLALAGTRLALASGLAVVVAPLALGITADAAGVVVGWALVLVFAVAALALVAALPDGRPGDGRSPRASVTHS